MPNLLKNKLLFPIGSLLIIFLLLISFFFPKNTHAQVADFYYVATSGSDSNPGTIERPWRTIAKANREARAGDVIFLRAGTYEETIQPERSGTSASRIIYRNYQTERVIIFGINRPLVLSNRSFITIRGLEFINTGNYLIMENGDYNNIEYNTFANSSYGAWRGMNFDNGSSYNWIHNNSISGHGEFGTCASGDCGDMIWLDGGSNYNLFENNEIYHGGHSLFAIRTSYNVIRNNYFHNEVWKDGYGNRDMNLESSGTTRLNLIEGNIFADAAIPNDVDYSDGIQHAVSDTIYRFNSFYNNQGNGLKITTFDSNIANNNHVYHNVMYGNGVVTPRTSDRVGLKFNAWAASITGNVVKNNIFYQNLGGPMGYSGSVSASGQIITNNLEGQNPLFVGESSGDFRIQAGSPAIDAGGFLARTTSAGAGTTISVNDAYYFSDGFGIVAGDRIIVGGNAEVNIVSVNYSTNTLVVNTSISWNTNDPVSLPYCGSAPDIGLHEFDEGGCLVSPPITPPPSDLLGRIQGRRVSDTACLDDGIPVTITVDCPNFNQTYTLDNNWNPPYTTGDSIPLGTTCKVRSSLPENIIVSYSYNQNSILHDPPPYVIGASIGVTIPFEPADDYYTAYVDLYWQYACPYGPPPTPPPDITPFCICDGDWEAKECNKNCADDERLFTRNCEPVYCETECRPDETCIIVEPTPTVYDPPPGGAGELTLYCDEWGDPNIENTGRLWTAIGCIPIDDTNAFLNYIIRWAMGISGGIALVLIVYSGLLITTSQGNFEKIQAGKQLLTATISGLVLIVFSIFILRLIGVDILGIL